MLQRLLALLVTTLVALPLLAGQALLCACAEGSLLEASSGCCCKDAHAETGGQEDSVKPACCCDEVAPADARDPHAVLDHRGLVAPEPLAPPPVIPLAIIRVAHVADGAAWLPEGTGPPRSRAPVLLEHVRLRP